jgi:hypothetical protein
LTIIHLNSVISVFNQMQPYVHPLSYEYDSRVDFYQRFSALATNGLLFYMHQAVDLSWNSTVEARFTELIQGLMIDEPIKGFLAWTLIKLHCEPQRNSWLAQTENVFLEDMDPELLNSLIAGTASSTEVEKALDAIYDLSMGVLAKTKNISADYTGPQVIRKAMLGFSSEQQDAATSGADSIHGRKTYDETPDQFVYRLIATAALVYAFCMFLGGYEDTPDWTTSFLAGMFIWYALGEMVGFLSYNDFSAGLFKDSLIGHLAQLHKMNEAVLR